MCLGQQRSRFECSAQVPGAAAPAADPGDVLLEILSSWGDAKQVGLTHLDVRPDPGASAVEAAENARTLRRVEAQPAWGSFAADTSTGPASRNRHRGSETPARKDGIDVGACRPSR